MTISICHRTDLTEMAATAGTGRTTLVSATPQPTPRLQPRTDVNPESVRLMLTSENDQAKKANGGVGNGEEEKKEALKKNGAS